MNSLHFSFTYTWEPLLVNQELVTLNTYIGSAFATAAFSRSGACVYKWEGVVSEGPQAGRVGVLYGETTDLRQYLTRLVRETGMTTMVRRREIFLKRGNIRLFILQSTQTHVATEHHSLVPIGDERVQAHLRAVYVRLLVVHEHTQQDSDRWLVNDS